MYRAFQNAEKQCGKWNDYEMHVAPYDKDKPFFNRKVSDKALPLMLIPTTCGAGSEGNGFAVLTNTETGDKKNLRCNANVAKASIVDPDDPA